MSEFFTRQHIDQRTDYSRCSDIYGDSVYRVCCVTRLESDDLSVVEHSRVVARQHRMLTERSVVHAEIAGRAVMSDGCVHTELFDDLVLKRCLVSKSRLVYGDRFLYDVGLEFEVRHISRRENIVLLFLLERLDGYIRLRINKAGQPYALRKIGFAYHAALGLARLTGVSAHYPDPALSAQALSSAGVIQKQACVEHYLHQTFAGGKIKLLFLRHYFH